MEHCNCQMYAAKGNTEIMKYSAVTRPTFVFLQSHIIRCDLFSMHPSNNIPLPLKIYDGNIAVGDTSAAQNNVETFQFKVRTRLVYLVGCYILHIVFDMVIVLSSF